MKDIYCYDCGEKIDSLNCILMLNAPHKHRYYCERCIPLELTWEQPAKIPEAIKVI